MNTNDKCGHCGVPWTAHTGIMGTCQKLSAAQADTQRLKHDLEKSRDQRNRLFGEYCKVQIELQKANRGLRRLRAKLGRPRSQAGCYPLLKEVLEDAIAYAQYAPSWMVDTADIERWKAALDQLNPEANNSQK